MQALTTDIDRPPHGTTVVQPSSDLIEFEAIGTSDLAVVGDRAMRLARATRAGLPIPKGVVVKSTALGCITARERDPHVAERLDDVFRSLGRSGQQPLNVRLSAIGSRSSANALAPARAITRRCDLLHTVRRLSVTATLLGDPVAVIVQHDVDAGRTGELSTRPGDQRREPRLDALARSVVDAFGTHHRVEWAIDRADRLWIIDLGDRIA